MITFIAYFTVVPENAAAVEELLDHVATMSNTEPGEVYRDQEAVAAHGQTAWVTESVPKFLGLIDGLPDIRQYVSPGTAPIAAQFDGLS